MEHINFDRAIEKDQTLDINCSNANRLAERFKVIIDAQMYFL